MTIEQKALALIREAATEQGGAFPDYLSARAALIRAIEQHEAFRQEVSDAVEHYASRWPANARRDIFMGQFASFIIPKPVDPLVEVWEEVMAADQWTEDRLQVFRAAIEKRGGRIIFDGSGA